MNINDFEKLSFTDKVKHLYELADKYNILHAKLVFKTIIDAIQAIGYVYGYHYILCLKTLNSMLHDTFEKYGVQSDEHIQLSAMHWVLEEQYTNKNK